MKLTFLGAAGEVTGSCFLVETPGARFLVDCGLFQGGHDAERRNRAAFAFDPRALDFVLLTHAHIDHSGLLPRLATEGFRGPVYATAATCDLLEVMFADSARIHEQEAERAREAKARAGQQDPPLYTVRDAERSLRQLVPAAYDTDIAPRPGVRARFRDAGHILGSAIIELWAGEGATARKLVFSWCWPNSTPERVSQVTILLRPAGGGTDFEFLHEQFHDAAARDGHQRGWSESFVKLEQFLRGDIKS